MTAAATVASVLAAACLIAMPAIAQTSKSGDEIAVGQREFTDTCAVCHGVGAKGDGPLAQFLTTPPADLTQLAKENGGRFPFSDVYQMIAGGREVRAHGGVSMPVWGEYFAAQAFKGGALDAETADTIARGRILSVVYYLQTLQER